MHNSSYPLPKERGLKVLALPESGSKIPLVRSQEAEVLSVDQKSVDIENG